MSAYITFTLDKIKNLTVRFSCQIYFVLFMENPSYFFAHLRFESFLPKYVLVL